MYHIYLTKSATTLRTFRQHLPYYRLFHLQIFLHVQIIRSCEHIMMSLLEIKINIGLSVCFKG